jgi:hypothetical protein
MGDTVKGDVTDKSGTRPSVMIQGGNDEADPDMKQGYEIHVNGSAP